MIMTRHVSVALMLGLALGLSACKDDFLTTVPSDRILNDAFWRTPNDFVLAINGAYRNTIAVDQMYIDGATHIAYSQQYWMRQAILARGTHDALYGWTRDLWARLYQGIHRTNDVLAQLETTTVLTPDVAAQLEGQARFLCGYYYHELLWM